MRVALSLASLLLLSSCGHEPSSRIVQMAEQSGAGPLADVSTVDMRLWLNGHPQIAIRVDALCAPLRTKATAAWPQTTEGRLCTAARTLIGRSEGQRQLRRNPDNAGFLPGWK
jgi:hypothetical protein